MPKRSRGDKAPADVIINLLQVMHGTPGAAPEEFEADDGKDKAAQALGRKGGIARAASMTPERRSEIASKAAVARWARR